MTVNNTTTLTSGDVNTTTTAGDVSIPSGETTSSEMGWFERQITYYPVDSYVEYFTNNDVPVLQRAISGALAPIVVPLSLAGCNNSKPTDDTGVIGDDDSDYVPQNLCVMSDPVDTDNDDLVDDISVQGDCRLQEAYDRLEDATNTITILSGYGIDSDYPDDNIPTFGNMTVVSGKNLTINADTASGHPVRLEMPETSDDTSAAFNVASGATLDINGNNSLEIYGSGNSTGVSAQSGSVVTIDDTSFENLAYGVVSDGATTTLKNNTFDIIRNIAMGFYNGARAYVYDSAVVGSTTGFAEPKAQYAIDSIDASEIVLRRNYVENTETTGDTIRLDADYTEHFGNILYGNHAEGYLLNWSGGCDNWPSAGQQYHYGSAFMAAENTHGIDGAVNITSACDVLFTNYTIANNYGTFYTPSYVLDISDASNGNQGKITATQGVIYGNDATTLIVKRSEGYDTFSYNAVTDNGAGDPTLVDNLGDYPNYIDEDPLLSGHTMYDGTNFYTYAYHSTNTDLLGSYEAVYPNWYDPQANNPGLMGAFNGRLGNFAIVTADRMCEDFGFADCDAQLQALLDSFGPDADVSGLEDYVDE